MENKSIITSKVRSNEEFVRAFQERVGLRVDGWAGPDTRKALDGLVAAPASKSVSPAGVELIKSHEGLSLKAYPDPGSGGEPWTIGYGHTGGVKRGDVITQSQADAFLRDDLRRFERAVSRLAPNTTQNQFDALVSFAFNLGEGNLEKSTLLKKHNAGDYAGAAKEFIRWNRAAGKVLNGLTRRRTEEAALYAKP